VDDLGSGSLLDTSSYGLGHERWSRNPWRQAQTWFASPAISSWWSAMRHYPRRGDLVDRLKKHPGARHPADKLCLAALSATLLHYLKDEAVGEIPVWRMMPHRLKLSACAQQPGQMQLVRRGDSRRIDGGRGSLRARPYNLFTGTAAASPKRTLSACLPTAGGDARTQADCPARPANRPSGAGRRR